MDFLPRMTGQLFDRFQEMSFAQRTISLAFVFVVGIGLGGLLIFKTQTEFQPVSFGKVFSPEELQSAEKALTASGLTGFHKQGHRILAPKKELERYNAALLEFDALPADLGTQMLKQYETLGPFSTDRQRQQMKEALLLQELRRMIKAVPDIEDARVAIASSERRTGWNQKPRATANVTITPRKGREISVTLVNSLRHVVASMVPDLAAGDVTIFDVTQGIAYTGESQKQMPESRYLSRAREFTRQYEQQILRALSYIPRVGVVVQVDLDAFTSSIARSEAIRSRSDISPVANRPATIEETGDHLTGFRGDTDTSQDVNEQILLTALPKAVRVSVSIPRDYLREIADQSANPNGKPADPSLLESSEDELLTKVERTVARLIPPESSKNAITVTCVDRLDGLSSDRKKAVPMKVRPEHLWIAATIAGVVVLFVLGSARPTPTNETHLPPSSASSSQEIPQTESQPLADAVRSPIASLDRAAVLRDEIRAMVQSDPIASADLLGKWLTEAPS